MMSTDPSRGAAASFRLDGKRGLVAGIANPASIATGCARWMRQLGADLAVTYLNDKARPHVESVAKEIDALLLGPCDVREEGQLEDVFAQVEARWGRLDFLLHSIAFAPLSDLHAPVIECSREGFALAMDVSVHSFIRMARLARPLMKNGGTMLTMSYYGAEKVVDNYNVMGPVKAALEAVTRHLATDMGDAGIRVHALSPGPILTRAASGIDRFDQLMEEAARRAPQHRLVTINEVGAMAAFLCTDAARGMTGNVIHVDAGYHTTG